MVLLNFSNFERALEISELSASEWWTPVLSNYTNDQLVTEDSVINLQPNQALILKKNQV
jgi:uncharacterized secreted protein with C-terminal beta-propeller domain